MTSLDQLINLEKIVKLCGFAIETPEAIGQP